MKNFTFSLFTMCLSFISIGQVDQRKISFESEDLDLYIQKEKAPIIHGKILNPISDATEVTYTYVMPFSESQSTNVLYAKPDGTFEIKFDHAYPYQQVWISIDTFFYTGAMVQSDLTIEVDAKYLTENGKGVYHGKGIKYSGIDGELNNYLNKHLLDQRAEKLKIQRKIQSLKRDRKQKYEDFKITYDSLYNVFFEMDRTFILENPSPYSWIIQNERMSNYLTQIIFKHWGKEMDRVTSKMVNDHQSYLVSNAGMSFYRYLCKYYEGRASIENRKPWDAFRGYSKNTKVQQTLIDSLIHYESLVEKETEYDKKAFRNLSRRAYSFFGDTIKEINTNATLALFDAMFDPIKADYLKLRLGNRDLKIQEMISNLALESMQSTWYKDILKLELEKTIGKVKTVNETLSQSKSLTENLNIGDPIGEMLFGAKMYKIESGNADDFLKSLKNTFEGKAMLLDFWATWCGPCISEMPSSKKLHEEAKDLPVEFIYLCTSSGSDIEKWKSKVIEMEQPGIHIFVDQALESELMEMFSFSGFPSYAFINKNGVYIPGIKRMSRTSKKELEKLIGE